MNKSKAQSKSLNWPSRKNFISYKKTENKCNSLSKRAKDGIMTNKKVWVKPFLTNNGCISNDFIGTENEGNLICSEQQLVELFNEPYINIVEKSSDKRPSSCH